MTTNALDGEHGLYSPAGTAWSLRLGGPHFHPGGEDGTVALASLARGFGFGAADPILDLGSGLGAPGRYLARRFGAAVIGVDIDAANLRRAHASARDEQLWLRNACVRATALRLPFATGTVRALWSVDMLSHLPHAAVLAEAARVAEPGALFVLADWTATASLSTADHTLALDAMAFDVLQPEVYRALIERAGFEVLHAELDPGRSDALPARDEHAWQEQYLLRFGPAALHAELERSRTWSRLAGGGHIAHWRCIARRR